MGIQNKTQADLLLPSLFYEVSVVAVMHPWSGEVRGCVYTGSNCRMKK